MAAPVKWTAIVLTCCSNDNACVYQRELEIRQAKGFIGKDVILLTVEDPKYNVGSGGASINALLTVTEFISARRGFTVINPDVLSDAFILILHCGRTYAYEPCGRAFMPLPVQYGDPECDDLVCCIDVLMKMMTEKLATQAPPGIWICSTDMLLTVPMTTEVPWQHCEACVITVPSTVEYCQHHGVYKLDKENFVEDILYQKDVDTLEECAMEDGKVPVEEEIQTPRKTMPHCSLVAEKLLSFHTKPPLDACTYVGLDSGQAMIQLSLFFDVMLPMTTGVSESEFVSGKRSGMFGRSAQNKSHEHMKNVRQMLWKELHGIQLRSCFIKDAIYDYLETSAADHQRLLTRCPYQALKIDSLLWQKSVHSHIEPSVAAKDSLIINSLLQGEITVGAKTILSNSNLQGHISIGKDSKLLGVCVDSTKLKLTPLSFNDSIVLQGFHLHLRALQSTRYVMTVHGRFDNIKLPVWKSRSSFCNEHFLAFLQRTGITQEDLFGSEVDPDDQTILNAKFYPVLHATDDVGLAELMWLQGDDDDNTDMLKRWKSSWRLSIADILELVDLKTEFHSRRVLFYEITAAELSLTMINNRNVGFQHLYNAAIVDGFSDAVLKALDKVALECKSPGIAARTLANIADVLGCMACKKGGLRSGPAANHAWAEAFALLESNDICGGVTALARERSHWLARPDLLIRAARHYEGAGQILIRHAVMSANEFFNSVPCDMPDMEKWVTVECPARLDLAGGWSDTPPITYEHGGAVTNVAIIINGKRPIGAKVKRIVEPHIILVLGGELQEETRIVLMELSDLEGYCHPHVPGALLMASFICADIIHLPSSVSLRDQLMTKYGGGFEIHTWSNLPHGSGLGTSSILAGAVMAGVLRASGKSCDMNSLLHAVLYLEQLLTTGGGWQDQVGGLTGGVKIGLSDAKLPLHIEVKDLKVSSDMIKTFNDRLILLYTGKTRLARNLVQDVVRNWYARNPEIVATVDCLVTLAKICATAFIDEDIQKIGACVSKYWSLKKHMAPGSEPQRVTQLMDALRPHAHGMSLVGAGGGGFLLVIMKAPLSQFTVRGILDKLQGSEAVVAYDACIDENGMQMTVEE